jgi:hypothetical protein
VADKRRLYLSSLSLFSKVKREYIYIYVCVCIYILTVQYQRVSSNVCKTPDDAKGGGDEIPHKLSSVHATSCRAHALSNCISGFFLSCQEGSLFRVAKTTSILT